ncbi:MAG: cytochrome b/b6 domain-containing protein [Betaproteobacteria bacterium]
MMGGAGGGNDGARPQLVWDAPIRLFHWLLVLAILALFVTANLGGNWMEWHKRSGYFVIGLLIFRLIWGVGGGYHARFINFVRGPRSVWAYVRGNIADTGGHNPLGALSVLAMLAVLTIQVGTGLFSNDDIVLEGPYARMVSKEVSDFLTRIHHINSKVMIGLIVLHLLAIGYYFFGKKSNLVKPMLTGRKMLATEMPHTSRPPWFAVMVILVAAGSVYLMVGR